MSEGIVSDSDRHVLVVVAIEPTFPCSLSVDHHKAYCQIPRGDPAYGRGDSDIKTYNFSFVAHLS